MKRNFLLLLALIIVPGHLYAQTAATLNGYVTSEEDNPIPLVNVARLKSPSDSTVVALSVTDSLGRFSLPYIETSNIVRFSCMGYSTKYILADTGDIQQVVLVEENKAIDAVTVKSSRVTYTPEGITYRPTTNMQARSVNGAQLLNRLNAPRIYVDPVSYEVKVLGGGQAVILINDRPASAEELMSVDPEQITQVDYTDRPSARFPFASVVLNFTVDRPSHGGTINANLIEGITGTYGEHYLASRLYYGRHAFSATWRPQFRNSFKQMRARNDKYLFKSGTVSREEKAIPAHHSYWFNNIESHYGYYGHHLNLDISGYAKINREWFNDFESNVLNTTPKGNFSSRNKDHNRGKINAYGANLYSEVKTPLGPLFLNADYGHGKEDYERRFEENVAQRNFTTSENKTSQLFDHVGLQGSYNLPIPITRQLFGMLMLSSKAKMTWYKNDYQSNDNPTNSSKLRNSIVDNMMAIMLQYKKLSLVAGTRYFVGSYSFTEGKNEKWSKWTPVAGGQFVPFDFWRITLDYLYEQTPPPLGRISMDDIFLDAYQIQRGNIQLGKSTRQQLTLNNIFKIGRHVNLHLQGKYSHHSGNIVTASYIETIGGREWIVRQPINAKRFQAFNVNGTLSLHDLWDLLSVSFYCGYTHYDINANPYFSHKKWQLDLQGEFSIWWREWSFTGELFYGEPNAMEGEIWKTSQFNSRFLLSYQYKYLMASIGIMNPLHQFRDTKYESLSSIAPYTRYAYNAMYENLVFAKLTYSFRWGQDERQRSRARLQSTEAESTTVRSER